MCALLQEMRTTQPKAAREIHPRLQKGPFINLHIEMFNKVCNFPPNVLDTICKAQSNLMGG